VSKPGMLVFWARRNHGDLHEIGAHPQQHGAFPEEIGAKRKGRGLDDAPKTKG
jgi:hypothetical protein